MSKTQFASALVMAFILAPRTLHGQADRKCDAALLEQAARVQDDNLKYKDRGNRCEGLYEKLVSASSSLSIGSFTIRSQSASSLPKDLELQWSAPMGVQGAVTIHGFALKTKTYYQMDAQVAGDITRFDWPTEVLQGIPLLPGQIGVTASFLNGNETVFLPVKINPRSVTPPLTGSCNEKMYQVTLWPGRDFEFVYFLVQRRDTDGRATIVSEKKELGKWLYPAARPISFCFSAPQPTGIYDLIISAEILSGGGVSLVAPFEHTAPK